MLNKQTQKYIKIRESHIQHISALQKSKQELSLQNSQNREKLKKLKKDLKNNIIDSRKQVFINK